MKQNVQTYRHLRSLLLLLMMTVGATGAWGQTDYSGTYFIANGNGYSSTNAANNFYLVPATNANYATDQPHLTTSKTGQVLNCCWQIVKKGDYYRIIHVADGKYLTANDAYPGTGTSDNGVRRLRVHLEEKDTPDDNTLFIITLNSKGGYNIKHKDIADGIYLDPAGGNLNGTNLTNARSMSTTSGPVNVGGGIGYWSDEAAARWQFEEVPQNNTYTYNIVDRQGNIAIKYTTDADQPAASPLSSYTDIPAAIRSPYLNGETVKFYTFSGAFDADNLTDENKITATPVTNNANIYVTYTTDHLSEKFLRLQGARAFNIDDSGCIYDNSGTLRTGGGSPTVATTTHLWYISGNDPYAVQIKNLSTGNYLVSSTLPTLSLAASATNNFILMEESAAANAAYEPVSLMVATGTGTPSYTTKDVSAYPVNSNVTYHLIDKAGKLIVSVPSTSSELALPDEWVSPLVSEYQYYKDAALSGTAVGSSCDFTGATTVTSPFDVGSGGHIYVKYTVGSAVDLTGTNNYLLKFSGGESFHQEDGHDGINKEGHTSYGVTTATKAIYPYNNGDFNLYVYGQEQWESQLASGASTRTRWLWKLVSRHDGTDLTGAAVDPYHVVVKSYQNHTVKDKDLDDNTKDVNYGPGCSYLQTYKPSDYSKVITNIAYENDAYNAAYPAKMRTSIVNGSPTEYMILGTSLQNMSLKTFNEVEGERRVVDSFEQYWKNNPTVETLAGTNPAADNATLAEMGWHQFTSWAYSAPWGGGSKTLAEGIHWYQTISMGSEFTVEEVSLAPQVILLDQHGWEVMRVPMSDAATLRKYDSPMVQQYQWFPTATKAGGYHKYNVSDQNIPVYNSDRKVIEGQSFTHNSTTLAYTPYDYFETIKDENGWVTQDDRVKSDFYVTYTVKSQYANAYHGAATEDAVTATPYLLKQNNTYATYSGSGTTIGTVATKPSRENLTNNIEWYLKPNFNIDREMGYKYAGETGAQDDAPSQAATELANYEEGRNGFDPYNVQIQNRAYPLRYFTANTTGSALSAGLWTGTSATVALQNMSTKQTAAGYDQTTLNITNATFMVVDDGNGNMRLMPRFDHGMVMQSFGTLATQAAAASPDDEGTGSQTLYLESVAEAQLVYNSDEITDPNGYYLLAESFEFVNEHLPLGTARSPFTGSFTGIIDGQLHTISSTLTKPLVNTANGAIIRNVILDNVTISSGDSDGNTGSIACVAKGSTRIYNCGVLASNSTVTTDEDGYTQITSCSSTISGSGYTGGLVGKLDEEARVINCFSYANITSGTNVGGIVGYNNVATTSSNLKTMVMNCMFYGDITGGTNKAPIYNGKNISNKDANGVSNYNYFWGGASYVQNQDIQTYNCALMAETRFLQRFEFFRHLLNSHRELAAWWATGSTANKDQMMKWVLLPSQIDTSTPYPILKTPGYYPSVVNIDAENAPTTTERNKGGKLGTLSVTIRMGDGEQFTHPTGAEITKSSLTLNITDKDPEHFNFNYKKVQLPYYNDVGTKNYTGNRVVTGWKIVSITGGTEGSFSTGTDATVDGNGNITATPYNFADRNCTAKDLYSETNKRVFNQGAYWDVPEGVTAITIEPYWAKAAYLADANADKVYNTDMSTAYDVPNVGGGQIYTNKTNYPIAGSSQMVYTNSGDARSALGLNKDHTVYDYAIVLVGNYHYHNGVTSSDASHPYTIMSADFDHDNEPDYSYILRFNSRTATHPVRVDFLNIPGLGMAQKSTGGTGSYNFGIMQPLGWFEATNTSLFRVTQFEYDRSDRGEAPYILQSGVMEQWVSGQNNGAANKTTYYHVGGNVWFKEFHRGTHQDKDYTSKHPPISVTGGDFDEFYLTGLYRADVTNYDDNAECYINGGRFGVVAGTGMEGIGNASTHSNGNITWQIQNADIREFYGGGINTANIAEGNITTTITGGKIDLFCGGPKFGDMNTGKTVVTTATGCEFGSFFGAGYGGNSYSRRAPTNKNSVTNMTNPTWNGWVTKEYTNASATGFTGISTQFNYQFIPMSDNKTNVARLFVEHISFSLATTHSVTSTLTDCDITGDFYGGGSLGKVDGPVTSTLDNCKVKGNVYGAGYSASLPTVEVDSIGFRVEPLYYTDLGTYRMGVKGKTTTYTWEHGNAVGIDNANHVLYTTEDLTGLGTVTGNVTLNIRGTTEVAGDVYGGGALASSNTDYAKAVSPVTTTLTTINLLGGTITGNVYGGGMGQLAAEAVGTPGTTGYVAAKEDVEAKVGNTLVNLNGMAAAEYKEAYSSWGLEQAETDGPYTVANTAKGCVVGGSIFGCNNINGTPLGNATVHVYKTQNAAASQIGNTNEVTNAKEKGRYDLTAVYGGGNLAPFIPAAANESTASTHVIIDGCDLTSIETVYGGGNAASTPATDVTVKGTFEIKELFGGGNGLTVLPDGRPNPGANVGYKNYTEYVDEGGTVVAKDKENADTKEERLASDYVYGSGEANVTIYGGTIHQVFGGSNTKGNVRISAVTLLDDQDVCEFCVDEAYGGGKSAPMDAEAQLHMACIPGLKVAYGGAEAANIEGDVTLNITNGTFDRVFGGNNISGTIGGKIIVNIEETGCKPVVIGQLYGGGNQASYDGSPMVNVRSFTSIGDVYGGGYGKTAEVTGDTHVNINVCKGRYANQAYTGGEEREVADVVDEDNGTITRTIKFTEYERTDDGGFVLEDGARKTIDQTITVVLPTHRASDDGTIGAIMNVYGGGNAAPVRGSTNVYVGTTAQEVFATPSTASESDRTKPVVGADIRGNVYGGGNQAKVTGDTHVEIGKKEISQQTP